MPFHKQSDSKELLRRSIHPNLTDNDDCHLENPGGNRCHSAAVAFLHESAGVEKPEQIFQGKVTKLFETNILRDEGDDDEIRLILQLEGGVACLSASAQADGSYYISGELLATQTERVRDIYIEKLLAKLLWEIAEPVRSALSTLKRSPIAYLTPEPTEFLES